MKATITQPIKLLGTSLELRQGQTVTLTPARNLPQGGYFAAPVDGSWGEDSILIQAEDFRPLPDPAPAPSSFLTLSYKNEWIQCNSHGVKWRGKPFASVRGAKAAISRFINSARPRLS